MNRLYIMLRMLTIRGYKKMTSCETGECFDIKEYMSYLNENEDIKGELKQIILSPKDILVGMFIEGSFHPMFKILV